MCFQSLILPSVHRCSAGETYCLPFHHSLCICVVHLHHVTVLVGVLYSYLLFICVIYICTDCSPLPSSVQDDGDVEDDMTIREVRVAKYHKLSEIAVSPLTITKQLIQ